MNLTIRYINFWSSSKELDQFKEYVRLGFAKIGYILMETTDVVSTDILVSGVNGEGPKILIPYDTNRTFIIIFTGENTSCEYTSGDGDKYFLRWKYENVSKLINVGAYIGFDRDERGSKFRVPLWMVFNDFYKKHESKAYQFVKSNTVLNTRSLLSRQRYLTMICSHGRNFRNEFHALCAKSGIHVVCPGKFHHNEDSLIKLENGGIEKYAAKHLYISNFLFNLCCENSNTDGYCTEKLIQSIFAGCIPIYWGDFVNEEIFNQNRIIRANPVNLETLEESVYSIQKLLQDEEYLQKFFEQKMFAENAPDIIDAFTNKFVNIAELYSKRETGIITIIIPYRDRQKDFDHFIKVILPRLKKCCNCEVIIVEQTEGTMFNRGLLLNVGFCKRASSSTTIVTYDINFEFTEHFITNSFQKYVGYHQLISYYSPSSTTNFGGIYQINNELFVDFNGFPNTYFGWGDEDGMTYRRMRNVLPNASIICKYDKEHVIRHKNTYSNLRIFDEFEFETTSAYIKGPMIYDENEQKRNLLEDGLCDIWKHAEIVKDSQLEHYRHIIVKPIRQMMFETVIILPQRNREDDLKYYIEHSLPLIRQHLENVKFVIVEQSDDGKLYNLGKSINIAFKEYQHLTKNFIKHDVDINPTEKSIELYKSKVDRDTIIGILSSPCITLGGIFKIDAQTIQDINGFPNDIWGWGTEDRVLYNRAILMNKKVYFNKKTSDKDYLTFFKRFDNHKRIQCQNISKIHPNVYTDNRSKEQKLKHMYASGLNNIEYTILSRKHIAPDIEHIKVLL